MHFELLLFLINIYQIVSDSVTFSHVEGDVRRSVSVTREISSLISRCIVKVKDVHCKRGTQLLQKPCAFEVYCCSSWLVMQFYHSMCENLLICRYWKCWF